jgi:hypothetical protein
VFSLHHPITGWQLSGRTGYHRTELVSEQWNWDGLRVTGRMRRRPLSAIFGPLRATGFLIDIVDEPQPGTNQPDQRPPGHAYLADHARLPVHPHPAGNRAPSRYGRPLTESALQARTAITGGFRIAHLVLPAWVFDPG